MVPRGCLRVEPLPAGSREQQRQVLGLQAMCGRSTSATTSAAGGDFPARAHRRARGRPEKRDGALVPRRDSPADNGRGMNMRAARSRSWRQRRVGRLRTTPRSRFAPSTSRWRSRMTRRCATAGHVPVDSRPCWISRRRARSPGAVVASVGRCRAFQIGERCQDRVPGAETPAGELLVLLGARGRGPGAPAARGGAGFAGVTRLGVRNRCAGGKHACASSSPSGVDPLWVLDSVELIEERR